MNILKPFEASILFWNESMGISAFDILAVGDGCLDIILTGLDGRLEEKQVLHGIAQHVIPGGGFTTPIVLQRLGVKVTWAADFGNDTFSKFIINTVKNEGVDLRFSRHLKRMVRRISVSLSTRQNRSFLSYEDASPLMPAAFLGLLRANARAVYMPGTKLDWLFLLGARIARLRKMTVIVDGNGSDKYRLDQNVVQQCLKFVDIFILNRDEALNITGEKKLENALRQLSAFSQLVVIKDGANGAVFLHKDEFRHVPAIPVIAVDTTGAGDNFNAGFIAAWLKGISLEECVSWGNIIAGLSTTVLGGATKKIGLEDIHARLHSFP